MEVESEAGVELDVSLRFVEDTDLLNHDARRLFDGTGTNATLFY